MAMYDVVLRLNEKKLPTLLQTVQGYATLQNISVIGDEASAVVKRASGYVNGKRNKGIKGEDLILEILSKQPSKIFTAQEMSEEFVKRGFAGNSYSPHLSKLKAAKKIVFHVGKGYSLK